MQNSFGDFLRKKRQEKNLTQKDLGKLLFVSDSTVSKWEKDISHPDISLLPKLSEILGVTEHELITASIDKQTRQEKIQAKKWRTLSITWSLFFYISYSIALLTCFICNLAVSGTLSWFWIVASALLLAFTFTNVPKLIAKRKLILIPLSNCLALILLFGVCCIYTNGDWFWIASLSVFLALVVVFTPIIIAKYDASEKLKKFNDFISVAIDFVLINVLLIVICRYTITNGYASDFWYTKIALPITLVVYLILNILLSVRFLKVNKLLKTSIILFLIDLFIYLPPIFIKLKNPVLQTGLDDFNILNANLSVWTVDGTIENNVHLIIFLTLALLAIIFLIFGLIKRLNKSKTR